jgi:hypothetical protein
LTAATGSHKDERNFGENPAPARVMDFAALRCECVDRFNIPEGSKWDGWRKARIILIEITTKRESWQRGSGLGARERERDNSGIESTLKTSGGLADIKTKRRNRVDAHTRILFKGFVRWSPLRYAEQCLSRSSLSYVFLYLAYGGFVLYCLLFSHAHNNAMFCALDGCHVNLFLPCAACIY